MGKGKIIEEVDPTAWMLDNEVANFVLLHQKQVLYMCMVSVGVGCCVKVVHRFSATNTRFCFYECILRLIVGIHLLAW